MLLKFEKWHGCKNDFILFWMNRPDEISLNAIKNKAALLCSRRGDGIGADGVIILKTNDKDDIVPKELIIINSDGSLANTCGNGIRCASGSVINKWRLIGNPQEPIEHFEFLVANRSIFCRILSPRKIAANSSNLPFISLDMGTVKTDSYLPCFNNGLNFVKNILNEYKLSYDTGIHFCDIGNLHVVIPINNLKDSDIYTIGSKLQKCDFWDGINVHLIEPIEITQKDKTDLSNNTGVLCDHQYRAYVWERGAGPTQACGSGACAIAVSSVLENESQHGDWISIQMPGGRLITKWDSPGDSVTLAGPQELVYKGEINL